MKTLCKMCVKCETYNYNRATRVGYKVNFTYCNGNKNLVENNNWYLKKGYPACTKTKKQIQTFFNSKKGFHVDHHDCNKLNNIMKNLREITHACNTQNRDDDRFSIYPGVKKAHNYVQSQIRINDKSFYLGQFKTELEAFHAYILKCKEIGRTINTQTKAYKNYDKWLNSDDFCFNPMIKKCEKKSKYKGVTWDKNQEKWQARVYHNEKTYSCGRHETEEKANQACIKKRKELNIIF